MNNHAEYIDRIDARAFKRAQQRQAMLVYIIYLSTVLIAELVSAYNVGCVHICRGGGWDVMASVHCREVDVFQNLNILTDVHSGIRIGPCGGCQGIPLLHNALCCSFCTIVRDAI